MVTPLDGVVKLQVSGKDLPAAPREGRLTLAPGVSLMAGDERWTAVTAGLGDPYDWLCSAHDSAPDHEPVNTSAQA